jgi:hypothetical protein
MQCILCKIYFSKVFHKYYNFICTPICTKTLFLQKVGVTMLFFTSSVDQYIIDEYYNKLVQILHENLVHQLHEVGRCIS